jgi:alpha-glucosidase
MDGFWNDMNEPGVFDPRTFDNARKTFPPGVVFYDNGHYSPHATLHSAYGMLTAKASYEGIQRLTPDNRPFLLSRPGFLGFNATLPYGKNCRHARFRHRITF